MIARLQIDGMAIIEHLSIGFSPGFNVITGETGAGKSILIKALNFLTGAKAGADTVRKGSPAATVAAEFLVPPDHPAVGLCGELGLNLEEAAGQYSLLVRRQLSESGRSQAWVNDQSVTQGTLKTLGGLLLDIFAQHENQRLMNESEHLKYLDAFLKDAEPLRAVERHHDRCFEIFKEIQQTLGSLATAHSRREYASYRLEALKGFEPSVEDFESVHALCNQGEQGRRVREGLAKALGALEGDGPTPAGRLRDAARALSEVESLPETAAWREALERLAGEVDDLGFEVGKVAARFDTDEGELEAAEARLFGYQNLFRKYGVKEVGALMEQAAALEAELAAIEGASARIEEWVDSLAKEAAALEKAASKLSQAREQAAARVKRSVEGELEELVMKGARFEVAFDPVARPLPALEGMSGEVASTWAGALEVLGSVNEKGAERGRFLLSANAGEPPLPLARIASGGEMSRILLALKNALVADADTCVLVFDEIDTGISGRVADVVGRKLRELAGSFQVLCISHLPQVAVYADNHLLVKKGAKGARTESQILALTRKESDEEIARLLSGAEVDAPSLKQAQNLRQKALSQTKVSTGRRARPRA